MNECSGRREAGETPARPRRCKLGTVRSKTIRWPLPDCCRVGRPNAPNAHEPEDLAGTSVSSDAFEGEAVEGVCGRNNVSDFHARDPFYERRVRGWSPFSFRFVRLVPSSSPSFGPSPPDPVASLGIGREPL